MNFPHSHHPKTTIARFNMIELVFSLVIVIVGIIGVVSFIPSGLESNQQALGISSAGDAAEQFLRYNASKIKEDWNWTNAFANGKPSSSDEPALDGWLASPIFEAGNVQISADSGFNESNLDNDGFFLLEQRTDNSTDFAAMYRNGRKTNKLNEINSFLLF